MHGYVIGKSEKLDESAKNKYLNMSAKVSELNKKCKRMLLYRPIIIQERLFLIWSQKPCHNCAAVIGNFKVHHGSFHTLKCREFLNDEVYTYI